MPPQALPPASETLEGARLALENADSHRACATSLAAIGQYGFAISHLVLATEEAVKSFTHFLSGIGLALPEADLRRLLTNHKARHAVALLSRILSDFIGRTVDVRSMFGTDELPSSEAFLSEIPAIYAGLQAYLAGAHDPEFTFDLEWWERANSLKQAGMYVDYESATGWRSPSSFSEREYQESATSVDRFFSAVQQLVRQFLATDVTTQTLVTAWLHPVVEQLNSGRAEQLSAIMFGSDGES
jgi:AbiV family abortive infection protein